MIPLFILVGADKGGVGKTTVSRALLDYLDAQSIPARVFDTEHPEGDLRRFRDNTHIVDILAVKDQLKIFEDITPEWVTIIDVRAGTLSKTIEALDAAGLLQDVREGLMNLAILHVLGGSVASLNEIAAISKKIGAGARHFLVRNDNDDAGLGDLADDPRYVELLGRMQPVTVNVSRLTKEANTRIQQIGVGFSAFVRGEGPGAQPAKHPRMLMGLVKTWLKTVWSEFDRVGLGELVKRTP